MIDDDDLVKFVNDINQHVLASNAKTTNTEMFVKLLRSADNDVRKLLELPQDLQEYLIEVLQNKQKGGV